MSNFYTNPQPLTNPPEISGETIKSNDVPINWSVRSKCERMETSELEAVIREASRVLSERKNTHAKKLIEKVCTTLNELKEMGNVEFRMSCDYDAYVHDILEEVDHFDASMFNIRG